MARQSKSIEKGGGEEADARWPSPWQTVELFGHADQEAAFLAAFNAGALHHAWLLSGEKGIGKATFAHRAARFLLTSPKAGEATTLFVPPTHPVARQTAAGAHPGLFMLGERPGAPGEKTAAIGVEDIRKLRAFLGMTSTGWRAVIVDCVNDLTLSSANALLKAIEEPPKNTLFFLVNQGAASVLATIRSRCAKVRFAELEEDALRKAVAAAIQAPEARASHEELDHALALAKGSPGRALRLLSPGILDLARQLAATFESLPSLDRKATHAFLKSAGALKELDGLACAMDLLEEMIEATARAAAEAGARAAFPWADFWQRFRKDRLDLEALNLDKGSFLLAAFSQLERVAREASANSNA